MAMDMPVVADATSTVFYPGKLLFALPVEFAQCYVWYTILHLLLAAMGAYHLTRCWHRAPLAGACDTARDGSAEQSALVPPDRQPLSRPAAGLCAVAYAFSGAVLFQYCNVVFLVGCGLAALDAVGHAPHAHRSQRVGGRWLWGCAWP